MKLHYNFVKSRFNSIFTYSKCTSYGAIHSMSLLFLLTFFWSLSGIAQCNNAFTYQGANSPAAGASSTLSTCASTGQNAIIGNVLASTQYISTSIGGTGNYITIRRGTASGLVVAFGYSPLTWTSTVSGSYFHHVNADDECGLDSECHEISIFRPIVEGEVGPGCTNTVASGSADAPLDGSSVTITTCTFAGEFAVITAVAASTSYISSVTGGSGNYITIRSGTFDGPLIAYGFSPLNWTSTVAGTYYEHVNTNAECGGESECRTLSLSRPQTIPTGCNNVNSFGSATAPVMGSTVVISTCNTAGDNSPIYTVAAATQYVSSATGGTGNYITIRSLTSNGTVIAAGPSPLNWTSTVAGTYYQHLNTTAACGTDFECHVTSISRPALAPLFCGDGVAINQGSLVPTDIFQQTSSVPAGSTHYWNVSLVAGTIYTFSNCVADGGTAEDTYVRLYNGEGVVVVSGDDSCGTNGSVTYTPTISGTYFVHLSQFSCNTLYNAQKISYKLSFDPTLGCSNTSVYGSTTAPEAGVSVEIGSCAFAGEYSSIDAVVEATQYVSSSVGGLGNYITIRSLTPSGAIIAAGPSPLTWTSTVAGTYYQHLNTNAGCGTDSECHVISISRASEGGEYNPCASITALNDCGVTNNITFASGTGAFSTSTCGYSTPAQEKIFTFTPVTTGSHSIAQTSSFSYTDYSYKVVSDGCNATGWSCFGDLFGASNSSLVTLTAGTQYYILVDPESSAGGTVSFSILCPSPAPNCTEMPISPLNNATNVTTGSVTLSWSVPSTGPAPTGYKVYYGTTSGSLVLLSTVLTLSTSVTANFDSTYYWKIVPTSVTGGDAIGCEEYSFSTALNPFAPYCSDVIYDSVVEPITKVTFAGIDNASSAILNGSSSLENFTAIVGNVTQGQTYTMNLKGNTDTSDVYTNYFRVFVDWNQDGDFDDSGESNDGGSITNSTGLDAIQATSSITIPADAALGSTRMRIKKIYGYEAPSSWNPCNGGSFGQTEDYTLDISEGCTPTNWYVDTDGDGYGTESSLVSSCLSPGASYVALGGDCNDDEDAINPGATEFCWNNIDDNCSEGLSEGCAPIVVNMDTTNGFILPTMATHVRAFEYTYPGVKEFRFSITNNVTGVTVEVIRPTKYVTIPSAISNFNTSYTITASAVVNSELVPYAGNTITVSTPDISKAKLQSTLCGATLTSLGQTISSTWGQNAISYTFRARVSTDDTEPITYYYTAALPSVYTSMNAFAGLVPQYGASYGIAVRFDYVDIATGTTVSSGYGDECLVNMPSFIMPTITLGFPACGSTLTTKGQTIVAAHTASAVAYQLQVRVTGGSLYYENTSSPSPYSNLMSFSGLTIADGTSYSISARVQIMVDGVATWSAYGAECVIMTPLAPILRATKVPFTAVAYPNPFAESFLLDVTTSNNTPLNIKVYDMIGRLVEQRQANVNELETTTIGNNYPSGVYNVIVTQDGESKAVRVVKR